MLTKPMPKPKSFSSIGIHDFIDKSARYIENVNGTFRIIMIWSTHSDNISINGYVNPKPIFIFAAGAPIITKSPYVDMLRPMRAPPRS